MLLKKYNEKPHPKEPILVDAVRETLRDVPQTSIPNFVVNGLNALRHDANEARLLKQIIRLPSSEYEAIR